ncbi:MAG: FHA domain-containing protein [Myxococcota bacterium]
MLDTLFISDSSEHHKLVRVNDNFSGEEFSLSEVENTIGRTDDNFILLSDPSISRRHAKIIRDGNRYTVVDLVSSNGTRLNGRKLDNSKRLKEGDLVEFGDVEFVFTSGDSQVDPGEYADGNKSGFKINLVAGVAILVVSCVALGGAIVYGFYWVKQSNSDTGQPAVEQSVELRATNKLEAAREHLQRREWQSAILALDEVIALDPTNKQAQQLKRRAQREQKAQELLRRGEEFSEQGRHADARAILAKIPEDTVAHEKASPSLDHVEKTLAYNYKTEAIRLLKEDNSVSTLREAHDKVTKSLELMPDELETIELVREIEEKLERKDADFDRYVQQ